MNRKLNSLLTILFILPLMGCSSSGSKDDNPPTQIDPHNPDILKPFSSGSIKERINELLNSLFLSKNIS